MLNHQHPEIITRLKRANGHLRMIVKMIEDGRQGNRVKEVRDKRVKC